MPTSFNDVNIHCPFYAWDDPKTMRIACEPILDTDDESPITRKFRRKETMQHVLEAYCCEGYTHCPYYQMLMQEKYIG